MSIQVKAFQFSLLIHGTLFAGLVLAGLLPTKQPPPVVIDFSLNLTEARAGEPAAAPGSEVPSPAGSASPQPQAVEAPPANSPPKPKEIVPQPKKAIPPKPRVHKKRPEPSPEPLKAMAPRTPPLQTPSQVSAVEGASPVTGSAAVSSAAGAGIAQGKDGAGAASGTVGGSPGDGGGMRYDFSYVRERILKKLRFPASARQRGQSGKIVVSFTLLADGQVERIAIVAGSGHEILDQAVIDTIRQVAPFPRPPVSAQLVLPIVFHLK